MEYVKCNNCSFEGYVEDYSDTCPNCNNDGTLQDYVYSDLHNDDCINVLKAMDSNSVDLILTDPPYGIGYQNNYTLNKHKKIINDDVIDYYTFGKE